MMCGGMMLLLIPGAISNSNAVIRQEFRKLRFQMIDDIYHGKRNFAARDVSVGSEHLPAKAVNTGTQSPGLCGNGVGGILPADFECLQGTIRINEDKARASGVNADIDVQPKRNIRARDGTLQGRAGFQKNRMRTEEHTSELQSHSDLVCRLL